MKYDEFEGLARALFEGAAGARILYDPADGRIMDANASAQRLCGFSLRDLLGTPLGELIRPAGRAALSRSQVVWKLGRSDGHPGGLLRTFRESSWLPVDFVITRLNVAPPLCLLSLWEAEPPSPETRPGQLRQLVAESPDCLWSIRVMPRRGRQEEWNYHYLSPVVRRLTDLPPDFFARRLASWRGLIHPDDQAVWDRAWALRQAGTATEDEYRLVLPDGSIRWVRDSVRVSGWQDGRSVWLFGVYTDVTARREAEVPMRRAADLVDSAEDAIIGQKLDGAILEWNRAAEELYGYTKNEATSRPALRLFEPEGESGFMETVQRIRRGESVEPYEAAQVGKDGDRIDVSVRVSPISNAAGVLDGVSIIARRIEQERPPVRSKQSARPAVNHTATDSDGAAL
jgi:PAS domain S-box-containing protein